MHRGHLKSVPKTVTEIPFQPASMDIWDKKYRLKRKDGTPVDETMDSTYQRVARALSEVEAPEARERWLEAFTWALRHGAIPAGRIISNAGAWEHKPSTSTINCTVSGAIHDSMDGILQRVHEAGLTLKAGCVAPGTWVVTEHGRVTADRAVAERHGWMLCYDVAQARFEMGRIERHMTTHVPRAENIEIRAHGAALRTSIRHPVLVYRDGRPAYVRADAVRLGDALIHHHHAWDAVPARAGEAWRAGADLGAPPSPSAMGRMLALRHRLGAMARKAEHGLAACWLGFLRAFPAPRIAVSTASSGAAHVSALPPGAPCSAPSDPDLRAAVPAPGEAIPDWIATHPERHLLPFLAGLIEAAGTVHPRRGEAVIPLSDAMIARTLEGLLGLFGVRATVVCRGTGETGAGHEAHGRGGASLTISDGAFLACLAPFTTDAAERDTLLGLADHGAGQDLYAMPPALTEALDARRAAVDPVEREHLGFDQDRHRGGCVSRLWLERWAERFPELGGLIALARTLRPVEAIRRHLDLPETFYDFTVERHHNYLAGHGGLMVIHNCGIGYEFSTLRPRGAYVSGAGAYTSGPLSFMDIYDKMCFTVSSAGGRRGAQMATFDVGHPDVADFIRAKREDGRLRQFNLSLLITEDFMEAVKQDRPWKLAFPVTAKEVEDDRLDLGDPEQIAWREWPIKDEYVANEAGKVACKVYKTIKARRLWDMIMASTYDYAEPGFILIDEVNEMNNNWWCENIRATNPCVTADTWVHTAEGPRQVRELVGTPFRARLDGTDHASGAEGFFATGTKPVVRLRTAAGYSLRLTADHRVRRVTRATAWHTETEWCAAGALRAGDRVLLNDHRVHAEWPGAHTREQGYLLGRLVGAGGLAAHAAVLTVPATAAAANGSDAGPSRGVIALLQETDRAIRALTDQAAPAAVDERACAEGGVVRRAALEALALGLGMDPDNPAITPAMERSSSAFYRGFLRGLFDTNASLADDPAAGPALRLTRLDRAPLEAIQRMLLRLGIVARIDAGGRRDRAGLANARKDDVCVSMLVIAGEHLARYGELIGLGDRHHRQARLERLLQGHGLRRGRAGFVARVEGLVPDGVETVYDVQVPGINAFDANGLHAHNCGEQPLPPFGSCLLGSVNLTRFVIDPFTPKARFDWETFRKVVAIFTRMLDNVVEINGLPLAEQREEIFRKRRHGMGYLGLGSTLTMLRMKYGDPESLAFTEQVTREMAVEGWRTALELAREKGPAPIMTETFTLTTEMLAKRPEMARDGWKVGDAIEGRVLHAKYSRYMQRLAEVEPELVAALAQAGARFTHHSSIAPTGTISLSLANNASNGIEPSFAHHYFRNVIREGRKTKEKVDVYSFELLAYRAMLNPQAMPASEDPGEQLPDYFITADDIGPQQHVDIQAAAQKWIDSSISKTANVPTDYPYEDFKDIYLYAYEQRLKGCTTFRFNPEAFQGVLVKERDLAKTTYRFTLEDGTVIEAKGTDEIEYDGETHSAANLYDALKEGYYGKF